MADENEKKPRRFADTETVFDLDLAVTITIMDLILALHDAKVIDKQAIAQRFRKTAENPALGLSENVKTLLRINAEGLEDTEVKKDE